MRCYDESWIKVKNKKHPAMLRVKEAFGLEGKAMADNSDLRRLCTRFRRATLT
jgi:hypothetical protein